MDNLPVPLGSKLISKITGLIRRDYFFAIVIAAIVVVLLMLGSQVASRMEALRSTPQDNAQWNLAQLDVELLALDVAAQRAKQVGSGSLAELRRRFNVYYSRVNTIDRMPLFTENLLQQASAESMAEIRSTLDKLVPLIDGPDEILRAKLQQIMTAVDTMRPLARQIGLDGVRVYAVQSDAKRNEFATLLGRTALLNGFLIIGLGTLLLFLVRQIRISRRRTNQLEVVSDRNASTVNSALDAIIAVNTDGVIVEFNPAAARIFGYTRNAAVGARLDELIVPERYREPHRRGMERYKKTGQKHVIDAGRVEMSALRADGSEFPIELSLGVTQATEGQLIIAFLRDISQRVAQEKELRTARDEALEAAKAKSQFLAIMSHEMRTPLNGVMAVLDLLDATKLDNKQKTYVKTAVTSAEILKQHVDDVLDLTRIQAGKLEFFPRSFNLVELLEEIENINLATAATRQNSITLSVDMPQPYFVADRKRIHQVLTNLIGNAIKFTENGRIDISATFVKVSANVVTIEFAVKDTGVGIAEEQQSRIFEDFVTLDASYQRSAAGAGLGLPICKNIVEAMEGEIGVTSQPGKGSQFWFRLPLKAAFADESAQLDQRKVKAPETKQRRLKVLVVEDNETNRFVAGEMLRAANCDVVSASDGAEGAKLASDKKFDVIFMDLSMPKMNGWDAARLIRSRDGAKSQMSPIYALTAHALPEEQKALRDAGMEGCILKPLRALALNDVLSSIRSIQTDSLSKDQKLGTISRISHIDASVLEELRDVLGQDLFAERRDGFLRELSFVPEKLEQMLELEAWEDLSKLAHKFAGSAAVFGAIRLSEKLRQLESAAKSKSSKAIATDVAEVGRLCQKTAKAFSTYA
jgi:PAS domain S-box-containing protein